MFFEKATKTDEIFTVNLILCSGYQIDGEDFFNFCGLLRKHELYNSEQKRPLCSAQLQFRHILVFKEKHIGTYFVKLQTFLLDILVDLVQMSFYIFSK